MYICIRSRRSGKRSERIKENLMTQGLEISVYRVCDLLIDVHHLHLLDALSSSSILDSHCSKYHFKLISYLDPVLQTTGRSRFVRCWHAKTDGWAASTFHSNCDGKGPTVTIVQVGSYIFGGYTDKSWSSPSKYSLRIWWIY